MRQENSQKMERLTAYPDLSKMGELTGLWIDEISYANLTEGTASSSFLRDNKPQLCKQIRSGKL